MTEFGYISDQPWQYTYQRSMSPQNIRLSMSMAGVEMPRLRHVCELAYGQGLSLCIHAACNPQINWMGTDFNPGHVSAAATLAEAGGMRNLTLSDQDIATFCAREDLARPDLVMLSGTWSWLPTDVQGAIAAYLSRALEPRGLFSLDYSTLPGMNGLVGLNHMLTSFAKEAGASDMPIVDRIPEALQQALAFMDTNPAFVGTHWRLRSTTEALQQQSVSDVAHEYFNHNSAPAYFSDLSDLLLSAGLSWMAPSSPTAGIDSLHLTPRQGDFLGGVADVYRREQLRDFTLNTERRSEIWSRGESIKRSARIELMREMRFILVQPGNEFDFQMLGGLGEIALARKIYAPLLDVLGACCPTSMTELCDVVAGDATGVEVCDALAILVEKGVVAVVAGEGNGAADTFGPARRLNDAIIARAPSSDEIGYLGSPVTGGGVKVARHHQVFLLAMREGVGTASALAAFAAERLKAVGSKPLPANYASPVLLEREAEKFMRDWHPIYVALGIA